MRTATAFVLRLLLCLPLILLAGLCDGIARFFETLSEWIEGMAEATNQITRAPYVRRWERLLAEAKEDQRYKVLGEMVDRTK